MNAILLSQSDFVTGDPTVVRLQDRRFHHIRAFLKPRINDTLKVGVINGNLGHGTIVRISDSFIELSVQAPYPPPPPLPVIAIIALPRPKVFKKVLQVAASLGIKCLYFIRTWKVEKSYCHAIESNQAAILENCLLGLEQAVDTVVPKVEFKMLFKPFIEDEVPGLISGTTALLAHPDAVDKIPRNMEDTKITLAIGPEGGFTDYEVSQFSKAGFHSVSWGERILRVEYALPAIIGRLF